MDMYHDCTLQILLYMVPYNKTWLTSMIQTLTFVYHATQNRALIKRETTASILVVSVASFISMNSLLLQLHLTRENEPEVPVFVMGKKLWEWAVEIFLRMRVTDDRAGFSRGGL